MGDLTEYTPRHPDPGDYLPNSPGQQRAYWERQKAWDADAAERSVGGGGMPGASGGLVLLGGVWFAFVYGLWWLSTHVHELHLRLGISQPVSGTANLLAIAPVVALVVWLARWVDRDRGGRFFLLVKFGLLLTAGLGGAMLLMAVCADRAWNHKPVGRTAERLLDPATLPAGYVGLRAAGPLNIRAGPGTGHPVVGVVSAGDYLALSPPDARGWSRILDASGKGRTGYVYRRSTLLRPLAR